MTIVALLLRGLPAFNISFRTAVLGILRCFCIFLGTGVRNLGHIFHHFIVDVLYILIFLGRLVILMFFHTGSVRLGTECPHTHSRDVALPNISSRAAGWQLPHLPWWASREVAPTSD